MIGKVNNNKCEKLDFTDLKCENTKLLKVGKIGLQSYAGARAARPTVHDVHIEVVEHFKYLGSLK